MYIEFQISEADYLAAVHLYARTRRGGWIRIYLLPPICLILALPIFAMCFISWRTAFVIFPLVVALLQPAANLYLHRRRLVRLYHDNISIQSRNFIDIDDAGDHSRDVATEKFTPWEKFSGYTEGKQTFVRFLPESKQFHMTPKRELTAAQVDELRALFKAHLPERPAQPTRRTLVGFTAGFAIAISLLWFGVPTLFWYREAVGIGRKSATLATPRPPSDKNIAQLTGSSMQAYGCSLTVPWKSINSVSTETNSSAHNPSLDYMTVSLSNKFILHVLNPMFQADHRSDLVLGHPMSSQTRRDLGLTVATQYQYLRSSLYAQPAQANPFAAATHNRRLFELLEARAALLWNYKAPRPIYELSAGENHAFQFGDPTKTPLSIDLELYTAHDRRISIGIRSHDEASDTLTQAQINAIVSSLHCSDESPAYAPPERSQFHPVVLPR